MTGMLVNLNKVLKIHVAKNVVFIIIKTHVIVKILLNYRTFHFLIFSQVKRIKTPKMPAV